MSEIGDYLWVHYYKSDESFHGQRCRKDVLEENLEEMKDKVVVIRNKGKVKGVAVYFTLSDETYALLDKYDLTAKDIVSCLAREHGPNVHFILVCAGGYTIIRIGLKEIKRRLNPKTVSWWSPDMRTLHRYKINKE